MTKQVAFKSVEDAALFHGEIAALSVFVLLDSCRSYLTIAPLTNGDPDLAHVLHVCPSEVEFL